MIIPMLAILLGLLLRIAMLGIDVRFHPDEALFAAQSRLPAQSGDWLLRTTDLDKPPLTFYTTALSFRALGVSEFAARLPNVLASGVSLTLLYALARALYRDHATATAAALLLALSPYSLAFAATVFTDVQATAWVLAAGLLAARDRWTGAGLAMALTVAAKPTALLFLPLILALGIAQIVRSDSTSPDLCRRLWAFAWPLLTGIALLLLWDQARAPRSFFELGYTRNQPGRLIRSDELWPRAQRWAHWLHFTTGSRMLNLAALALVPLALLRGLRRPPRRTVLIDWLIAGYVVAFLGWYWLVALNTYDRYLHTLIPFVLLLIARALVWLWRATSHRRMRSLLVLALLVVVTGSVFPTTIETLRGNVALGGDRGEHRGIDRLATYLNTQLAGATVYDHWLGWELTYYLGETPRVRLHYVPLPNALITAMHTPQTNKTSTKPRYFVAPDPSAATMWLAPLDRAGITATPIYHDSDSGFVIYHLTAR